MIACATTIIIANVASLKLSIVLSLRSEPYWLEWHNIDSQPFITF